MSTSKNTAKASQNPGPRRRGPIGWATDDMGVHLTGEVPAFRTAQAAGELLLFWPAMHMRFSAIFKLPALTPEEIARGVKMEDKLAAEAKVRW